MKQSKHKQYEGKSNFYHSVVPLGYDSDDGAEYHRQGIQYDNRYTYETGNPFLVSEISKNLNYELAYK